MSNLRRGFERFCFRNRGKGIPNLMLYTTLGSAVVYLITMISNNAMLYNLLSFDREAILHGQVWRLFTYAFTYYSDGIFFTALTLYCFYSFGRIAEANMGTLKFNIFFFSGIILQDIFCMITGTPATIIYLKLSMLLIFATLHPDSTIRLYFIIPIKTWVWVLINFAITAYNIFALRGYFPHNLFPLVAIFNFFLFFGKDALNILPLSWRAKAGPKKPEKKTGTIPFPGNTQAPKTVDAYTHRCTVCGRTDVSNPELEFRYCSRCKGYYCYCQEHINNHEHIE
ncbi:MAG: rhomboid family intramembrane serine protease [Oscillospiraceae bacterium]|nr:rhomboid family intramembrane serine protease [Oscillospiraceae bacterium]